MPSAPTAPPATLRLTSCEPRARLRRTAAALTSRAAGLQVWQAPAIAVRERWLFDQWAASWPDEQLLSPAQELAQWRRLVADDPATADLVSTTALARQLRAADRLVHAYAIDLAGAPAWTPEQAAFSRWHERITAQRLADGEFIAAQIPAAFAQRLRDGRITPPAEIILDHGAAHRLVPTQQRAVDALRQAGCRIGSPPPSPLPQGVVARRCPDVDTELHLCARDIAERLRALAQDGDAAAPPVLVVAVDDPPARAAHIDAVFTDHLAPWRRGGEADGDDALPWRLEPAPALSAAPLASVAADIIALRPRDNRFATVSRLLLSGALWPSALRLAAAALEVRIRERAAPRIHLRDLAALAPDDVQPAWQALQTTIASEPRHATPSTWATHFAQRLDALGWGAGARTDSAQWQTARQVHESLGQLAVLDRQLGDISAGAAAGWLADLMAQRTFAPRVDAVQPVVVCDYATAAEIPCAARWVLGATDAVLPPRTTSQPFIAHEILAEAGAAGVDAGQTLAQARALAAALQQDAESVTISFAATDASGAEQRPTPLITPHGGWTDTAHTHPTAAEAATMPTVDAAEMTDRPEPPLPPIRDPVAEGVRGGTGILRSCAASLFGAMVRHRLGVDTLPEPANGLDALTQGSIIHAVLASVWATLGDSAGLAACSGPDLQSRIDAAVDNELTRAMPAWRYPALVIAAERTRIRDLVAAWMAHERRRTDAFTVIAHEAEAVLAFEGLPLTVRVDRLDAVQTSGGTRHLIIDYKTGKQVRPAGWEADRLAEPQLPLYAAPEVLAALGIASADGIAFAHVHARRRALAAATNWAARLIDDDKTVRKPEQFQALLDATHARLRELTQAFLAGEATHAPGDLANDPLAVLIRCNTSATSDDADTASHDEDRP